MKLTLIGSVPSKKNSRINTRSGRSFPNPRYIEWRDSAILQVRSQLKDWKAPVPCSIEITLYHADRRRRDSDNALSSVLDMLKDCKVIDDDCWEIVRHTETWNEYDKGNPHCEIVIDKYKKEII